MWHRLKLRASSTTGRSGWRTPISWASLLLLAGASLVHAQDTDTAPSIDGFVAAIALQPDGKAIVGGSFTAIGGQPCRDICRLDPAGHVDGTFVDPNANGDLFTDVYALAIQPGGRILVGGTLAPTAIGASIHDHLLRLDSDGSVDATFADATPNGAVLSIAPQPDGRIWVGGSFLAIAGQVRGNLARLQADGSLDASVTDPAVGDSVRALALRPDGRLWAAGYFTTIRGQARHALARFDASGKLDARFTDSNANSDIVALALQDNGRMWVGGDFVAIDGQQRRFLASLDAAGSVDTRVADAGVVGSVALSPVLALAAQPDGKVWVGGTFVGIGGQPRRYLARLNADGSVDPDFPDPHLDGWVFTATVGPDGKLWIGGDFLNVGGRAQPRIARFNADGSLDAGFAAVAADGAIFAAGFE